MAVVYLGLGSNLGERAQHLVQAGAILHQHPAITVLAVSSLYQTAPVGFTDQAWFLNAVARVQTSLTPAALLSVTQATERRLGRTPAPRWGPRVIDIDILLYDAVQLHRPFLTIPHAAMYDRAFVLVPLHELAPDLQLPSGVWVRDRLATLPNDGSVQRYGPFPPFVESVTEELSGTY
jgi:2-amino-4-hydroxy-6-hydroxymethyldihydropteridine diphosphokinase